MQVQNNRMRKMTYGLPFVYEHALTCVYLTNSGSYLGIEIDLTFILGLACVNLLK